MFEESEIRREFGEQLEDLGISCFTLYTHDSWNPRRYIPHDIDTHLYYPESLYVAPPVSMFQELQDSMDHGTHPSLSHKCIPNVAANASFYAQPPVCDHFPKYRLLFSNFVAREDIKSLAYYCPKTSPRGHSRLKEMLFFSFREPTTFKEPLKNGLLDLAERIIISIPSETKKRERSGTWSLPLLESVHRSAYVSDVIQERLLTELDSASDGKSIRASDTQMLRDMLSSLFQGLISRENQHKSNVIILLRLLQSTHGLDLVTALAAPEQIYRTTRAGPQLVSLQRHVDLAYIEQDDSVKDANAGVNICTTMTGRAHLINYVDPEGQTSIPLDTRTYRRLEGIRFDLIFHQYCRLLSPCNKQPARLLLHKEPENATAGNIRLMFPSDVCYVWDKLLWRAAMNYSQMFREEVHFWQRPCSELCLPINVNRQTIGCLNIEVDRPYAFSRDLVTSLSSVTGVIGLLLVRRKITNLLDSVKSTVSVLSAPQVQAKTEEQLDAFAVCIQQSLLCDRVDICTGSSDRQSTYCRIASSAEGWRNNKAVEEPRRDGATAALMRADDVHLRGIVYEVDPTAQRLTIAVSVHRRDNDVCLSRTEILRDEWPSLVKERPCRLLFGIRMFSSSSGDPQPLGIMWCFLTGPGRLYLGGDPEDDASLKAYVRSLLQAAECCSIIPEVWRSHANQMIEFFQKFEHESLGQVTASARSNVFEASQELERSWRAESSERKVIARRLDACTKELDYVHSKISFLANVSRVGALKNLEAPVSSSVPLKEALAEAFHIAQVLYSVPQCDEERLLAHVGDHSVHVPREYLRVLLVNILHNSLKHGLNKIPADSAELYVEAHSDLETSHLVKLIISNGGNSIPEEFLSSDATGDSKGRHLGLSFIRALSEMLGERECQFAKATDEGGASVSLWLMIQ